MWFTKARRAQKENDYETWVAGGVVPTLNAFDNGDVRTTVLIMRQREGKPGGGKGPMLSERSFTLATNNDQTVFIIDGTRVGDVRVYEDGIVPTVISRYGTGGGNVPMIFPIQDGRDMEKNQNGLGVGEEFDPSYTLDRTGGQAIAYSIREDAKANNFSATELETSTALQAQQPSVQSHHAQTFIAESTVRRLTPTECERLQGFPDGWTEGQADSSRYKQMGNAVAVPVVSWIIERLVDATL